MTQEDYFSQGMLPPEMGVEVADGIMQGLDPQLRPEVDGLTSDISGQLADISDEELAQIIQLVQQLYDDEANYAQNRAALIQSGELTEEDLPPQYDPEALAMMLYVLRKEQQARSGGMSMQPPSSMPPMAGVAPPEMQPPQGFARGGIAEAARIVAGSGRFGDTMLAHINPREAKLLRKHGGSGTINPKTGLPEFIFKFLRKAWQAVWKPVKKFLNSSVGKVVSRIALNVLLPGYGEIIYAGLQTAASGGEFKDIIKNMAIAGVTQYLGGQIPGVKSPIQGFSDKIAGNLGIESALGKEAFLQGAVNTGAGLLQGQDLKTAATSGLLSAGTVVASSYLKGTKTDVDGNPAPIDDRSTLPADGRSRTLGADADIPTPTAEISGQLKKPQPYVGSLEGIDVPYQGPLAGVDFPYSGNTSTVNQPQVNVGTSTNMQTGASGSSSVTAPYKPVSVGDAFSTMGEGTKQMFKGDVSGGFNKLTQGAEDLFLPSSPTADQLSMRQQQLLNNNPRLSPEAALQMAKDEAPGLMRTYGPAAAAGVGILAMSGGFSPPGGDPGNPNGPQFRGPTGEDLINADPNKYRVNIGDPRYATLPDIQVASNYNNPVRYADGGEVMPDYLAEGGTPRIRPMGISNLRDRSRFAPYMKNMPVRIMGKEVQIGIPNIPSSMMGGVQGVAARMRAKREAEAAAAAQAAAQAAARAAANAPGQANKLYAANPDQYRPNMEQPVYLAQGGNPQDIARMMEAGRQRANQQVIVPPYQNRQPPAPPPPPAERPITTMPITLPPGSGPTPPTPTPRPTFRGGPRFLSAYGVNSAPQSGGIAGLAQGGYPRKTGQISGPGTETSDSIPAMLSDGEFVMTAKAVRGLGKGSRREGAKKMYALMHQLERNAARG
jgi:hypothetical protein